MGFTNYSLFHVGIKRRREFDEIYVQLFHKSLWHSLSDTFSFHDTILKHPKLCH